VSDKLSYSFDTTAIHGGQTIDPTTKARAVPIYQTTSYGFDSSAHAADLFSLKDVGYIYTRIGNPTTDVLEKRLAQLEGGSAALAVSSGQAAITLAILNLARAGDNLVSSSFLYGGTYNLFHYTFAKLGITVKLVDASDPSNVEKAIDDKTKCVYLESIGNPKNNVDDYAAIAEIAHRNGIPLIVDNTVTTPYLLRPFEHGADIVVHSLTKFIGGHGTSIGGAILESGTFDWNNGKFPDLVEPDPSYHGISWDKAFGGDEELGTKSTAFIMKARCQLLRDLGPVLSPFNSFLFLQGLETLHLRMRRHCENALKVAKWLQNHPSVEWVNYPGLESHPDHDRARKYLTNGFGAIIGFGIKGGYRAGTKLIDSVRLISHLANIGDAKTLIIHPASTTHQQLSPEERAQAGVSDEFIRLSVGIEDPEDIIADLDQAIRASQS